MTDNSLRIGHTTITYGYIMAKTDPSSCPTYKHKQLCRARHHRLTPKLQRSQKLI